MSQQFSSAVNQLTCLCALIRNAVFMVGGKKDIFLTISSPGFICDNNVNILSKSHSLEGLVEASGLVFGDLKMVCFSSERLNQAKSSTHPFHLVQRQCNFELEESSTDLLPSKHNSTTVTCIYTMA